MRESVAPLRSNETSVLANVGAAVDAAISGDFLAVQAQRCIEGGNEMFARESRKTAEDRKARSMAEAADCRWALSWGR